ncbi:hypothetical protein VTH06DRAFT_6421 [Thermothelomyces fergusii]
MRDIEERTILSTGKQSSASDKEDRDGATRGLGWIGRLCISGCGVLGSHTTALIHRSIQNRLSPAFSRVESLRHVRKHAEFV